MSYNEHTFTNRGADRGVVRGAKILIADDSAALRSTLRVLLESCDGWEVCADVANGRDAVSAAKDLNPDLVVLDLVMPGLDGLSAADRIAKFLPSVPILLYTIVDVPNLETEARKHGVGRVISKSKSEKLIPAIRELLAASASIRPKPPLNSSAATDSHAPNPTLEAPNKEPS